MKIHILFEFKDGPWGGGNQFLKMLRGEFESENIYENDIEQADIIIYNSYHNLLAAIGLKIKYPEKIFVHRLGPYFHLHRGSKWKIIDSLVINVSNLISDLIIFQSKWSYEEALKLDLQKDKAVEIIGNAANGTIFNGLDRGDRNGRKTKLVTDSWSSNSNKGFSFYEFLDNNLDFSKYEMTFIGNSPINFNNIRSMLPLPSHELARELNKNDIFVSAVQDDAYSNSIVEALACGLPVVALDSGGNAEIIRGGGDLFENKDDMLDKIETVRNNYDKYKENIDVKSTKEIAGAYLSSIERISRAERQAAQLNTLSLYFLYLKAFLTIWLFKILQYVI